VNPNRSFSILLLFKGYSRNKSTWKAEGI